LVGREKTGRLLTFKSQEGFGSLPHPRLAPVSYSLSSMLESMEIVTHKFQNIYIYIYIYIMLQFTAGHLRIMNSIAIDMFDMTKHRKFSLGILDENASNLGN